MTLIEEAEAVVRDHLAHYTLPANVHVSNLYGYPVGDTHLKVAERAAEDIVEALRPLLAQVWEEGYASAHYAHTGEGEKPRTCGNPYEAED